MLGEKFAGGIAAKFITSYIGDYNSIAVGVDLGINYYDPETEWSVSMCGKESGWTAEAYDNEYEKMPIDLQLGVTKRFANAPFRYQPHWST